MYDPTTNLPCRNRDMSVADQKLNLISRIALIEDQEVLEAINQLIDLEEKATKTYSVSESERRAIERGMRDLVEGQTFSSEAAEQKIQEWLKKR